VSASATIPLTAKPSRVPVSTSTAVFGAGAYRPVTGSLTFTGKENLTTGAFTEIVSGTLCGPRGG